MHNCGLTFSAPPAPPRCYCGAPQLPCAPQRTACLNESVHNLRRPRGFLLRANRREQQQHQRRAAAAPAGVVAALQNLHPASKAHDSGRMQVSPLHNLAYEVHGSPKGWPVLCVHGGPGAGAYANHARFFHPDHWRIILIDQRGCGSSTPRGCLEDNTTQALIQDFELLREALGIHSWVLFGGSWGTALSLAYAQRHTNRCDGIIVRAVCTMSQPELDWMYRGGVAALQPKAWADFLALLSEAEQADPLSSYYARLTSSDTAIRDAAASAWLSFDMAAGKVPSDMLQSYDGQSWSVFDKGCAPKHQLPPLQRASSSSNSTAAAASTDVAPLPWGPQPSTGTSADGSSAAEAHEVSNTPGPGAAAAALASNGNGASAAGDMSHFTAQAMLTAHYSANGAFLSDEPILQDMDKLRGIPAIAVQGRLDLVCPPITAFQLHTAWPELRLRMVGGAGHSQYDPAITHELLEATSAMRQVLGAVPRSSQSHTAAASGKPAPASSESNSVSQPNKAKDAAVSSRPACVKKLFGRSKKAATPLTGADGAAVESAPQRRGRSSRIKASIASVVGPEEEDGNES